MVSKAKAAATLSASANATAAPTKRKRRDGRIAEILAAARELLETHELSQFTIADVAKAVGVSEATVFAYFGSRRELIYQVISNWMNPVIERLETDLRTIDDTVTRLRFFVTRHLHELNDAPGLHRLIYRELHWDDYYGSQLHRLNQRYTRLILWVIEEGKRLGDIKPSADAEIARDQVFGTLHHVGWRTIMNGRALDIDAAAGDITDQIFGGLRAQTMSQAQTLDKALCRLEMITGRLAKTEK